MTASFSNPRLSASPCERMRGASFAENFVTDTKTEENLGTDNGTGNAIDYGLTTDGNGYYDFGVVSQPGDFSVTIQIKATSASTGVLVGNVNLIAGAAADGFCVWTDGDGVKANHSDGISIPTECAVTVDYTDGETHTITYVVDETGGKHYLYVNALAVDEQTTSIATAIGSGTDLVIGGDGTNNFVGTLYKPRIFDAVLTETEHDLYHAGTVESFFRAPLAAYPCDSFCNDTDGNKIWDRTTAMNDLFKADKTTGSKFPTFDTDKYFFDFVDDYIDNLPTLPTNYTITAATSTPQLPYPEIQQDNDLTLWNQLSNEGDFWGYLHSLVVHGAVLTALQLYHDEYQHFYWLARGRAAGLYHRLITEQTCKVAMFLDSDYNVFTDYSRSQNTGIGFDVTRGGAGVGVSFPNTASHVLIPYDSSLNFNTGGTIVFYGDFDEYAGAQYLFQRSGTCTVTISGSIITFNGFACPAVTLSNNKQLAFTWRIGSPARMFIDGEYVGSTGSNITHAATTNDAILGNSSTLLWRSKHAIEQFYLGNEPLTDEEIKALFEQAQSIGATSMETGNRIEYEETFTAVAVDLDLDPGGPFQLVDVAVNLSAGATTSEDLTITTLKSGSLTKVEHVEDLSLSTDTDWMFRFDKRFADGRTLAIDYTNTDGLTIKVHVTYQMDQSVV